MWVYGKEFTILNPDLRRPNMVGSRAITKDNLNEVLRLNISEQQKTFVSSTALSLTQAYVYRETAFPFAIYADNTVVGFIMMGYYEATPTRESV